MARRHRCFKTELLASAPRGTTPSYRQSPRREADIAFQKALAENAQQVEEPICQGLNRAAGLDVSPALRRLNPTSVFLLLNIRLSPLDCAAKR